mmetsp:Transcript_6597/g.12408  ORF Transcript_6597/g.12408 Transcript_6597/m.12408 type:complete len:235 (+) Transcript_6597:772-1476(+)
MPPPRPRLGQTVIHVARHERVDAYHPAEVLRSRENSRFSFRQIDVVLSSSKMVPKWLGGKLNNFGPGLGQSNISSPRNIVFFAVPSLDYLRKLLVVPYLDPVFFSLVDFRGPGSLAGDQHIQRLGHPVLDHTAPLLDQLCDFRPAAHAEVPRDAEGSSLDEINRSLRFVVFLLLLPLPDDGSSTTPQGQDTHTNTSQHRHSIAEQPTDDEVRSSVFPCRTNLDHRDSLRDAGEL